MNKRSQVWIGSLDGQVNRLDLNTMVSENLGDAWRERMFLVRVFLISTNETVGVLVDCRQKGRDCGCFPWIGIVRSGQAVGKDAFVLPQIGLARDPIHPYVIRF